MSFEYSLPLVAGVGALCFLIAYLMNSLDSGKHEIMKLLLLLFIASAMLLIPKATVDSRTVCDVVVANSTEVTASLTAYEYTDFCYTRPETTSLTFLRITQLLFVLIIGYVVVALALAAMQKMATSTRGRR